MPQNARTHNFDRDTAEQHVSLYDYEFDSPELVNNVDTPSEITDFDNFIMCKNLV